MASLERRYRAALKREDEGKLHSWERLAVIGGQISPIQRDREPGVVKGQQVTLLSSPEKRTPLYHELDRLRMTGEVSVTPKRPLLVMTITGKRRRRKGGWEIVFDVWDGRDREFYVRRTPPATPMGETREPTQEEIDIARFEGAYTSDVRQAVEPAPATLTDKERKIAMQARLREAERLKSVGREETARRDLRSVTGQIQQIAIGIASSGADPEPFLVDVQRVINSHQEQAKAA